MIDVSAMLEPASDPDDQERVAWAIDDACRRVGFVSIVGHGIATELQERLEEDQPVGQTPVLAHRGRGERPFDVADPGVE